MIDKWYDIPGFDKYQINKFGDIKNKKTNHIVIPQLNNGYKKVRLWTDEKRESRKVHRLLAQTFIPNPDNLPVVNHIDGNKLNNDLDNLEWCTVKHNNISAIEMYYHNYGPNPNAGRSHRPVRIVETGKEYKSMSACAREIKGDPNKIQDCLSGRQKSHRGFHFEDV